MISVSLQGIKLSFVDAHCGSSHSHTAATHHLPRCLAAQQYAAQRNNETKVETLGGGTTVRRRIFFGGGVGQLTRHYALVPKTIFCYELLVLIHFGFCTGSKGKASHIFKLSVLNEGSKASLDPYITRHQSKKITCHKRAD